MSFVGSTAIARYIYETAAREGKRVQALGGAKNHMVVLPDADLADAAEAAVSAGFGSAGERCMAASVLVAVGGCGDELVKLNRDRVNRLAVGPGTDATSETGRTVTSEHRDKVASYLGIGESEGASIAIDGRDHDISGDPGGYWLGPCLIDNVTEDMKVYTDEIFGPVLSLGASTRWTTPSVSSIATATAMGRPSSPATGERRSVSRPTSKPAWSASTWRFPCPLPTTPSVAGTVHSSATCISTVPTGQVLHEGQGRDESPGEHRPAPRVAELSDVHAD